MGPKEDPEDKKARLLERKKSTLERRRAAQKNAGGMTSDMRSVYGLDGISMFGMAGTQKAPASKPAIKRTGDH